MTKTATFVPACIDNLQLRRHPKEHKFDAKLKGFWKFLVREMQGGDSLTCETSKWAKDWGVSSQTIRNWLKFFEDRKLIKIIGGGPGRGRKWIIKFTSWVRKKVEFAIKGIKSLTKKRLDELERKYLKSLSWTGENPKNPNNVFNQPKHKDTLRDNTQENSQKTRKDSIKRWKIYQTKLSEVSDDTILKGQGTKPFDDFMAQTRLWLWEEHGLSIELDDMVSNAIGSLVKNKPFSFAIKIWNKLRDNISKLLSLLKTAVTKNAIYAKIRSLFSSSNKSKRKARANIPNFVDGETYDLRTPEGRRRYESDIEQLFKETYQDVIRCPRCGKQLTKEIFENPLQHYDEKRCICVYICRDRAFQHRAQHTSKLAEASTPVNNSLLGQTNVPAIQAEEF